MSKEIRLPARPPLPLPLFAVVTCIFVERAVMAVRPGWVAVAVGAALLLVAAIAAFMRMGEWPGKEALVVCLVTALAALLASSVAAAAATEGTRQLEARSVSAFELEISSDMVPSGDNMRGRCLVRYKGHGLGEAWLVSSEPMVKGTRIRCVGRFTAPGDDSWGRAQRGEGLLGSIKVVRILEEVAATGFLAKLEAERQHKLERIEPETSDSKALVAALSLGWRGGLKERGLDDVLSACGMSHVAAVSGTHVTVVCALVGAVLLRLRLPLKLRIVVLVILTGLFVLASGAAASAVRAWLMCICALSASMAGRRSYALSALSLCCLAMALARPSLSGNIGFLLSFSCVAGLCLFAPYATYVIQTLIGSISFPRFVSAGLRMRLGGFVSTVSQGFAVAVVAAIAALPITASAFGELSLIGPFANALLAPAFSVLVGLSVLTANASVMSFVYAPLMSITQLMGEVLVSILRACARLPSARVSVELELGPAFALVVGLGVLVYVFWRRVNRKFVLRVLLGVCVVGLGVFLRWRYFAPARLCVLDVGQGDAILVQDGSAAVLVDTGPGGSLANELGRLNVSHLDAIVLTHLHDDHYGGVAELAGHVSCDAVYVGEGAQENLPDELAEAVVSLTGKPALELAVGATIHVGSFSLELLWPREPRAGTENEDSLVILASYQRKDASFTALLTGDAEHEVLAEIIKDKSVGDIDVLKVGHHGSEISLDARDAETLKPELALASAGEGNSYGHPSETCVSILEDAGARFLCTKDVGTIVVEPRKGGLHVRIR